MNILKSALLAVPLLAITPITSAVTNAGDSATSGNPHAVAKPSPITAETIVTRAKNNPERSATIISNYLKENPKKIDAVLKLAANYGVLKDRILEIGKAVVQASPELKDKAAVIAYWMANAVPGKMEDVALTIAPLASLDKLEQIIERVSSVNPNITDQIIVKLIPFRSNPDATIDANLKAWLAHNTHVINLQAQLVRLDRRPVSPS